ncbi:MAG: lactate utilization protein [Anaerolineaceae bacterium]|nr:lactate utilization protein [Anaerolineaceae bacterium]
MSSREAILGKLRERSEAPFPAAAPPQEHRHVVPLADTSAEGLYGRFVQEATKAVCIIHEAESSEAAIAAVLQIVGEDTAVSSWSPEHIPLPGLAEALDKAHIARVGQDASVRVGLTGVDAALAATGSLVILSGNGRFRASSLLPPVHIAVLTASQIVPDLESWCAAQAWTAGLEQTRQHSNIAIITGPSRTADIAMQLVLGMHGPGELHLVLLTGSG